MNLLLTRPISGGTAFWNALPQELRDVFHPVFSPLIEIQGVTSPLPQFKAVIFTSANGVKYAPHGRGRAAYCVGANTTECAIQAGWNARQAGETAQQLLVTLQNEAPKGPLLHLGGDHIREDISGILSYAGIKTQHIVVYKQISKNLTKDAHEALSAKFPLLLPLFSPRTASNFMNQSQGSPSLHIVAMSDEVAKRLEGVMCRQLIIAARPTRKMMLETVQMVAAQCTSG